MPDKSVFGVEILPSELYGRSTHVSSQKPNTLTNELEAGKSQPRLPRNMFQVFPVCVGVDKQEGGNREGYKMG